MKSIVKFYDLVNEFNYPTTFIQEHTFINDNDTIPNNWVEMNEQDIIDLNNSQAQQKKELFEIYFINQKNKITFRFNNSDILDDKVNYETLNFIKKNSALTKTVIDNIERDTITREFYLNYDKPSNTYNDIVLKEHKIYLKNADNFPEYQLLRIEYYSKTDEIIHTKEIENPLEFVKSREIEKQLRDFKIAKISQLFIDEAKVYNNPKAFYLGYLMSEILNEPQDKYLKFNPYTFLYYLENIEAVITASPLTQEDKTDLIYLMTKTLTIENKTGTIAHQMLDILDIVEIEVNP